MKKILSCLVILGISNFAFALNCDRANSLSYGDQMMCESLAQAQGSAAAYSAMDKHMTFSSNKEIIEYCKKDNWFGGYFSDLYLSNCATKLGYK